MSAALNSALELLPRGPAWSRSGVLALLFSAVAVEYDRVIQRGQDLLSESFPDSASELLPDWERLTGLDPVTADEEMRRALVVNRLWGGHLNRLRLQDFCDSVGYELVSVTITGPFAATVVLGGDQSADITAELQGMAPVEGTLTVNFQAATVSAPTVEITAPSPGVVCRDPFIVAGNSTHAATVELLIDDVVEGSVAPEPDGTWSIVAPSIGTGDTVSVKVRATGPGGVVETVAFDVDADYETFVTITSPLSTSSANPTVSGTGETGGTVDVYVAGALDGADVPIVGGVWSHVLTRTLTPGESVLVEAFAADACGNLANVSYTLTRLDPALQTRGGTPITDRGGAPIEAR